MKKFIYTSVDSTGKPKKQLIYTTYLNSRFKDTQRKLVKAKELAYTLRWNSRTQKQYDFWNKQFYICRDLLRKQVGLRQYERRATEKFKQNLEQFKNFI